MKAHVSLLVLVVDHDVNNLSLVRQFEGDDIRILTAQVSEDGFDSFVRNRPQIVLLRLDMPDVSGTDLMKRMLQIDPGLDVIITSPHYTADCVIGAIKQGARDFLSTPLQIERLRERISALGAEAEQRRKTLILDQKLTEAYRFEGIVGRSPMMLEVFAKVARIAPHFRTALITGATGTGKELIANALHRLSPATGKLVVCNCSALVDTLVESELFGHVRGAFTGAIQDKAGMFEHAHGGTIFLDEIGELSLSAQAKLLRVLQTRTVQRVGSVATRNIDVRVIAATHRNLKAMVREGQFREDLYYRLAIIEVTLPALASRREDIPLLLRHFVKKLSSEYRKNIAGLTRRAQQVLSSYPWPGNVRELESVIGNACMMAEGNLIDLQDLPERFRDTFDAQPVDENLLPLEEVQRRHVLRVLEGVWGNKARAAEVLGIGRATIYHLLSRMKLAQDESA